MRKGIPQQFFLVPDRTPKDKTTKVEWLLNFYITVKRLPQINRFYPKTGNVIKKSNKTNTIKLTLF